MIFGSTQNIQMAIGAITRLVNGDRNGKLNGAKNEL